MPWAKRTAGTITALFSQRQDGYAEEEIAEDHADVVAFRNPPPAAIADTVESRITEDPAWAAFVRRTAKKEGITERALLDEIRAEAKEIVRT